MAVRTTVEILEPLHDMTSGTKAGVIVTEPMITGEGKLGPEFPVDENPYGLIFP